MRHHKASLTSANIVSTPSHYMKQKNIRNNAQRNLNKIWIFSLIKMHFKTPSAKWRPFCLGLNILTDHKKECAINGTLLRCVHHTLSRIGRVCMNTVANIPHIWGLIWFSQHLYDIHILRGCVQTKEWMMYKRTCIYINMSVNYLNNE